MTTLTVKELRALASRTRDCAQHADRTEDYKREMAEADSYDHQANQLADRELANFVANSDEVKGPLSEFIYGMLRNVKRELDYLQLEAAIAKTAPQVAAGLREIDVLVAHLRKEFEAQAGGEL